VRRLSMVGIVLFSLVAQALAQAPRTFDAASIKRNTSGRGPIVVAVTGNRLSAPFVTLRELIRVAYDVDEHQVVGGPGWLDTDRFEVGATIPAGASMDAVRNMLRELLSEPFALMAHAEERQLPVYDLQFTGRLGPKMRPAGSECAPVTGPPGIPAPPPPPPPLAGAAPMIVLGQGSGSSHCPTAIMRGFISARDTPVEALASILMRELQRLVTDRTGLNGGYDFDLSFLPDSGPMTFNGQAINADAPPLTTALREQLGLRLDSVRGPVNVVVVDRVTPPTEN
jgi:uncharacterized protein (TIGR03435 family)